MGQQPVAVRREIPRVRQGERPVGVGGRSHPVPTVAAARARQPLTGPIATATPATAIRPSYAPPRRLGEGAVAGYKRRDRKAFKYA